MVKFLRKLTRCIDRNNSIILNEEKDRYYLKLSRFELMSDEIIINIFEYISLIDLYKIFRNLNYRLNYLLRFIKYGIKINEYDYFNKDLFLILFYFSKQIYYLNIDYNPFIHLKYFKNLNKLIIYYPSINQLKDINSNIMPNLNYLSIGLINKINENIIFKNIFHFQKLNSLYLYQINFINLNKKNYFIKKLFLINILTKDFIILLLLLPNLYHLQISISDYFIFNHFYFYHFNLKILKIEFLKEISNIHFLNSLLSFLPNIEKLTFLFINLIQIKYFIKLENIILNKLIKLKIFILNINYYCYSSSNQLIQQFYLLKTKYPFFKNIIINPCFIHHDHCLTNIYINKIIQ